MYYTHTYMCNHVSLYSVHYDAICIHILLLTTPQLHSFSASVMVSLFCRMKCFNKVVAWIKHVPFTLFLSTCGYRPGAFDAALGGLCPLELHSCSSTRAPAFPLALLGTPQHSMDAQNRQFIGNNLVFPSPKSGNSHEKRECDIVPMFLYTNFEHAENTINLLDFFPPLWEWFFYYGNLEE